MLVILWRLEWETGSLMPLINQFLWSLPSSFSGFLCPPISNQSLYPVRRTTRAPKCLKLLWAEFSPLLYCPILFLSSRMSSKSLVYFISSPCTSFIVLCISSLTFHQTTGRMVGKFGKSVCILKVHIPRLYPSCYKYNLKINFYWGSCGKLVQVCGSEWLVLEKIWTKPFCSSSITPLNRNLASAYTYF